MSSTPLAAPLTPSQLPDWRCTGSLIHVISAHKPAQRDTRTPGAYRSTAPLILSQVRHAYTVHLGHGRTPCKFVERHDPSGDLPRYHSEVNTQAPIRLHPPITLQFLAQSFSTSRTQSTLLCTQQVQHLACTPAASVSLQPSSSVNNQAEKLAVGTLCGL